MTDSSSKVHILVVDDEETLAEVLRMNLEIEGYIVDTAHSAEEALTLDLRAYDLFLLDIMMGNISGIQLAKIIKQRHETAHTPIIFLSARDSENDMIEGLDLGADDYIAKPYTLRNISARVRAVLRRTQKTSSIESNADNHSYRGIVLSRSAKVCTIDGQAVKFPRKEFEILSLMLANRGRIFSREELINHIWPNEVVVLDRVIDVNITRLRSKLGAYSQNIVTRSGYGYGFIE